VATVKLVWTPGAVRDLEQIHAYIAAERLPICLFVNTDQSPPGLIRDTERLPNRS